MAREQMREREDRVISGLCRELMLLDGECATILARPDREPGAVGGCDAILLRLGRQWAVEHTTFDSFINQREEDARVQSVLSPTGPEIARAFPDLHISIGLPRDAVVPGTAWKRLAQDFQRDVVAEIRSRYPGPFHGTVQLRDLVPVALSFRISKITGCYFPRLVSELDEKERVQTVGAAVVSKMSQLQPYADDGLGTALLVDNDDLAQLNPPDLALDFEAWVDQAGVPPIDEIWLVDTTEDAPWFTPLKLGDRMVRSLPEFGQYYEARLRAKIAKP